MDLKKIQKERRRERLLTAVKLGGILFLFIGITYVVKQIYKEPYFELAIAFLFATVIAFLQIEDSHLKSTLDILQHLNRDVIASLDGVSGKLGEIIGKIDETNRRIHGIVERLLVWEDRFFNNRRD